MHLHAVYVNSADGTSNHPVKGGLMTVYNAPAFLLWTAH